METQKNDQELERFLFVFSITEGFMSQYDASEKS